MDDGGSCRRHINVRTPSTTLLTMPADVVMRILQSLSLREMAVFDTAVVSCDQRPTFLQIMASPKLCFHGLMLLSSSDKQLPYLLWLICRNIGVDCVWIEGHQNDKISGDLASAVNILLSKSKTIESITLKRSSVIANTLAADLRLHIKLDIKSLDFSDCYFLSDESVMKFAETCPNLRIINLSHCGKISDHTILKLSKCCPQLQNINLRDNNSITDMGIGELSSRCNLREIHLINRRNVTDIAAFKIAEHCQDLESITLSSPHLTDAAIVALATNCSRIRHATFSWCRQITDAALIEVAASWSNLEYLNVSSCSNISNVAVTVVARSCGRLETIKLRSCRLITDAAVRELAEHCPRLRHVDLSMTAVGDAAVIALLTGCAAACLRRVLLLQCPNISHETQEAAKAIDAFASSDADPTK